MDKFSLLMLAAVVFFGWLAQISPPQQAIPSDPTVVSPSDQDTGLEAQIERVKAELAVAQQVWPSDVTEVARVKETWRDTCMGFKSTQIACTPAITPGYIVYLRVKNVIYTAYVSQTAIVIVK